MRRHFLDKILSKKFTLKIYLFGITLALFFLIGCLFFLRPKTSDVEKRALTEYPKFTLGTFWNGEYFSQVSTWYSDTYPMREMLISGNKNMQELYGVQSEQLVGNTPQVADDIPDRSGFLYEMASKLNDRIRLEMKIEQGQTGEDDQENQENQEGKDNESKENEGKDGDGTITEKGETLGSIYVTKDAGYEMVYFNKKGADHFVSTINDTYGNVKDKVNLYVMVIPTAAGAMLDESVIEDMNASDQKKIMDYLHSGFTDGVKDVQILDELRKHNSEYIYFRTDHHWTQRGAYYGYIQFCREKGFTPNTLDSFETLEIDGFTGTFCQQAAKLANNPDTVIAYIPKGTNEMTMIEHIGDAELPWKIVNDVSSYAPSNYYATFAGGDTAFACAHNETITDGSAIMVVKDSFGNAFIPWLIDHYEYVYWLDIRYTNQTISSMVEQYGVQDVLVMFSVFNATTDDKLDELARLGQ